ncbi:hypothetical protein D3273_14980 [Lichenibacterium minor]|uniref:DUF6460 domain-containing protein n=1 Tax=Lichenibacterium minor TaxID=2316528 RepID=A0A4V1RUH7_9HYPH|nr:DUF6460 domain-containing protein [Lichenibacterium minor]RYC31194.1 hypothetical protein D3273_14980 [Lichenibacterium minor]
MPDSVATRFIGGSPLAVLIRLVAVSLIVGALMSWLGIDALDLLDDLQRAVGHLYGSGFAALRGLGGTVAAGAAVVLPVWLVLRVLSWRGPQPRLAPDDARRDARPEAPSRWSNPERARD